MRPLLVIAIYALVACKAKEEAPPTPKPAEPTMVPENVPPPPPGTTASGIDLSKLGGQLKYEAAHRPHSGITVEQVFAALAQHGIEVERQKQLLGKTVAAGYCADARTPDGLVVVICEYDSASSAEEKTKLVEKRFAVVTPNATRKINGATVLTVVHSPGATGGRIDQIISIFAALQAPTTSGS
jgi:hypothetical protein